MAEAQPSRPDRSATPFDLGDLRGRDGPQTEQILDDRVLGPLLHCSEQFVALALVLVLRVPLAVAAQADPLLQVVESEQVVLPGAVDHAQHVMALGGPERFGAVRLLLLGVAPLGSAEDRVLELLDTQLVQRGSEVCLFEIEVGPDLRAHLVDLPVARVQPGGAVAFDQVVHDVAGDLHHVVAPLAAEQDVAAQLVDRFALLVHHVVVLEQVLADLEVPTLDLRLGAHDGPVHHAGLDRHAFLHAEPFHQRLDPVRSEDPHQVVLQGEVEARGAGIALAARTTAELVVDATRLVPLGAEDVQAAGGHHLFPLRGAEFPVAGEGLGVAFRVLVRVHVGQGQLFGVAAEDDVRAAARHVGGDRHRAAAACLGHDRRLALVVLRVQHHVPDPLPLEQPRQHLAVLDGDGAYQHRLAVLPAVLDLLDHGVPLLWRGAVHEIRAVFADHGLVGRHDDDVEVVDLAELAGLGVGRSGHAGQLLVQTEVVLERDRCQRLVFALDPHAFLGFDRLVQAVGPAPAGHLAAGELVDDHDLAVLDQVLDVAPVEVVRAQPLVDRVQHVHVLHLEQVADAQELLDLRRAFVRECRGTRLLVADEISGRVLPVALANFLAALESGDDPVDQRVLLGRLLRRAGDDQRRSRLVDQDRVDLVHDREVVASLDHGRQRELHVVAQVVEAELVVRPVGDVRAVCPLALLVGQAVLDRADVQTEELVDLPHPLGVPARQVVVHGDHMDAVAGQGVEVDGQSGNERLALAGLHLRDLPPVENDAAQQLDVVVPHSQGPARGLADGGECGHQQIVEAGALVEPGAGLAGATAQLIVAQRLELRLEGVDRIDERLEPLQIAVVLAAEDSGERSGDHRLVPVRACTTPAPPEGSPIRGSWVSGLMGCYPWSRKNSNGSRGSPSRRTS